VTKKTNSFPCPPFLFFLMKYVKKRTNIAGSDRRNLYMNLAMEGDKQAKRGKIKN